MTPSPSPAAPPTVEGLMDLVHQYGDLRGTAAACDTSFELRFHARNALDGAKAAEEEIHAYASRLSAQPAALTDEQIDALAGEFLSVTHQSNDDYEVEGARAFARAVLAAQKGASNDRA